MAQSATILRPLLNGITFDDDIFADLTNIYPTELPDLYATDLPISYLAQSFVQESVSALADIKTEQVMEEPVPVSAEAPVVIKIEEIDEEHSVQPEESDSLVKSRKRTRKKSTLDETYESREAEIRALRKEIRDTEKKREVYTDNDPKQKRLQTNAWSALISRRNNRLRFLLKEQEFEDLKTEMAQVKGELSQVKCQNKTLKDEVRSLKARLVALEAEDDNNVDVELSIQLPRSSMFIKYQSPTTSPRKPVNLGTVQTSMKRTRLTDKL